MVVCGRLLGALDRMDAVLGVFYAPPLAEGQVKEAEAEQVSMHCCTRALVSTRSES